MLRFLFNLKDKMDTQKDFDVIVIGAGHAGIEAAYAAANMGSRTLLVTLDLNKIALMRCNPAVGGIGKGHIVFELSALGGLMPKLCTQTYLQARMLNTSKGPAVRGLRLQIDKDLYNKKSREMLEKTPNLTLMQAAIEDIIVDDQRTARGIVTDSGQTIFASSIVLTTGTFLNGQIYIGSERFPAGGKPDEKPVTKLTTFFDRYNIACGRLKTGTPPRLLKSSVHFDRLEKQEADNLSYLFEFHPHEARTKRDCYITRTNERTHEIIRNNLHLSAARINNFGKGPRYCPSLEDKITRFPQKNSHQIFVEPETNANEELYPNGISTSLPREIQTEFIRSIRGFEDAIITNYGYAIEYDYVLSGQLDHTLGVRSISGLFLAGQINGTTGYEEAAGQGIIAGINAHLKAHNLPPFILDRTQSYIGVMIDDLITLGVDEPYRMFTSRAERRLTLRQDNAFARLTERAYNLGLIQKDLYLLFKQEQQLIANTIAQLRAGHNNTQLLALFGHGSCTPQDLQAATGNCLSARAAESVQAEIRYEPYLKREEKEIEKAQQYKKMVIPADFDYSEISGLSIELRQKLSQQKPETIAQATIIPGITPAALSVLIFKIQQQRKQKSHS